MNVQIIISVLGLLVFPALFFLWRTLRSVRENDLRHIESRLEIIERKIDTHIAWHADH